MDRNKVMTSIPNCSKCHSQYVYNDGIQWVCSECAYEWSDNEQDMVSNLQMVKDANGGILNDGDTVILIKDLKVKGSTLVIKQGTKVKNIRLQAGDHNIACKVNGSMMNLKSEFVKKAG